MSNIVTDEQLRELFKNIEGDDYRPCVTSDPVRRKNLEQTYKNPHFRAIALARATDSDFEASDE